MSKQDKYETFQHFTTKYWEYFEFRFRANYISLVTRRRVHTEAGARKRCPNNNSLRRCNVHPSVYNQKCQKAGVVQDCQALALFRKSGNTKNIKLMRTITILPISNTDQSTRNEIFEAMSAMPQS